MSIMRLASIVLLAYWALIFVGTHLPSARMPQFACLRQALPFCRIRRLVVFALLGDSIELE